MKRIIALILAAALMLAAVPALASRYADADTFTNPDKFKKAIELGTVVDFDGYIYGISNDYIIVEALMGDVQTLVFYVYTDNPAQYTKGAICHITATMTSKGNTGKIYYLTTQSADAITDPRRPSRCWDLNTEKPALHFDEVRKYDTITGTAGKITYTGEKTTGDSTRFIAWADWNRTPYQFTTAQKEYFMDDLVDLSGTIIGSARSKGTTLYILDSDGLSVSLVK